MASSYGILMGLMVKEADEYSKDTFYRDYGFSLWHIVIKSIDGEESRSELSLLLGFVILSFRKR